MLIACPADRLGVELPAGGPDAISAEDLQRDSYSLSREADPGAVFARRLDQMHLPARDKGEGRVCALRGGEGAPRVVVAPWPTNPGEAAQGAVLISLAKGWDGQPAPPRATWLCLAKPDAPLPEGERVAVVPIGAQRLEDIDYRKLRDETKKLFATLQ